MQKVKVKKLTHLELCQLAAVWIRNQSRLKFPVTLIEVKTIANEIPDVLAFNAEYSVMIECKTTRRDFLKEKEKPHRINPETGVGDFRIYFCPTNLIKKEEIPEKFGLIYVDINKKIKVIKEIFGKEMKNNIHEKNCEVERRFMYSALRRVFEVRKKVKSIKNFK